MTTLRVVRALPARWDHQPVEWDTWREDVSSIRFHGWEEPCDRCGSTDLPWIAWGRVYGSATRIPVLGFRRTVLKCLCAFRCPNCLLDTVHDETTGKFWELGPEDYGPQGSHEITGMLW